MASSPTYSVVICNYNMGSTIGISIKSILDQVGKEWEIVVVDGGSTDGSRKVVEKIQEHDSRVVWKGLDPSSERHLGRDRQIGVEEARGKYVIQHLDADDRIQPYLTEYVDLYDQICNKKTFDLVLIGGGALMAPRELLLKNPYQNLRAGEDKDLWRRLYSKGVVVWIDIPSLRVPLLPPKSKQQTLKRWYDIQVGDFQCGISLRSYFEFLLETWGGSQRYELNHTSLETVVKLCLLPLTYLSAEFNYQNFNTPDKYRRKGYRHHETLNTKIRFEELERKYEINTIEWGFDSVKFFRDRQ